LLDFLIYSIATVTVLWHLFYAYLGPMPRGQHANIHLGFLLVVFYLVEIEREPSGPREYLKNAMSILFAVAIAAISLFVHLNYFRWLNEARSMLLYTDVDIIVGALAIIITLHATWRAFGFVLAGLIAFVMVYGYAGELFPGILYHSGFTIERLIFMNSISLSGVYGFVLGVGATWVAIFLFFAGIVEAHGGLDDIIAISRRLGEKLESGFVQMAVVASMMMGSIVGSSAANVATTGNRPHQHTCDDRDLNDTGTESATDCLPEVDDIVHSTISLDNTGEQDEDSDPRRSNTEDEVVDAVERDGVDVH
jgi:TRAP-type uncharacterized transport system fused permease subunit